MFDLNLILGATKIKFYKLSNQPNITSSLYNEKKRAKYEEPIYLTGMVEHSSTDSPFKDSNIPMSNLSVTLTSLAFTEYQHVTGDDIKDHPPIDPYSLVKGYFYIEGQKFEVQSCTPEGLFADTYTSYKYACMGVDKI